jgi:serine/threonine protein kinase/tetratricopeptide (TPR) repeat protein
MKCPKCQAENPETKQFCGDCGTKLDVVETPPQSGKLAATPKIPPPDLKDKVFVTQTLEMSADELGRGTVFAGRYEIIEELGAGGMGKIYRAFDRKVEEEVALKLLLPEIAADRRIIERFRNELKIARKITHPNVCRMHDLNEEGRTLYITMEYVRGEDLKSLIRRTKQLAPGTAVAIVGQVAEGLAAAHKLGVIHRDLKPHNIMIDKEGNAKIMDFGIARSLTGAGTTAEGVIIGTPEYMSPEQVEGKPADARTDIYSLGVILFEMVTGRVPFEGDTPLSVAHKHRYEQPPEPRKINPQVPDSLSRLILRCLEKEREKRYQTAEELLADLETVEGALPFAERAVKRALTKRRPTISRRVTVEFTPRRLVIPLAVVLVLAGTFLVWRFVFRAKPAPSPITPSVPTLAVLDFENLSNDESLDFWRGGIPEQLITGLYQSRFINVLTRDRTDAILKKLGLADAKKYTSDDLAKIAAEGQITQIVTGSYLKAGTKILITLTLQDPRTHKIVARTNAECQNQDEIISKANDLVLNVKQGLNLTSEQLSEDSEFYKRNEIATTSSVEAFKYYLEGRRLHLGFDFVQSVVFMEKAVEVDPQFAMAYRSMAASYGGMEDYGKALKYGRKALELSGRLPELERMLIEASNYSFEENYAKGIEVLERLLKIYPENLMAHSSLSNMSPDLDRIIALREFVFERRKTALITNTLALAYMEKGLYQKAEDVCRSFLRDVEDNEVVRAGLFSIYQCRRQFDLAFAEAEKLSFLKPGIPEYKAWMGETAFLKDDLAGAEKFYQQAFAINPHVGRIFLIQLDLGRGKFNEAASLARHNLTEASGSKEWEFGDLTSVLEKWGRFSEASQTWSQHLQISADLRKSGEDAAPPYLPSQQRSDLFIKGRIQAEMGSFAKAQKTAGELRSLGEKSVDPKDMRYFEHVQGLVELLRKNPRKAAELFARACGRLLFEGSEWEDSCDHALFFDGLARALYESGELDKARKEYEKITLLTVGRLAHGDIHAKAYYMLGKIAEQQGDKARARENYGKFLDLWKNADPGLPEVEDAKKRLASL